MEDEKTLKWELQWNAKKAFVKSLIKAKKEFTDIHKNLKAQYGKHADLADVIAATEPALNKHGLVILQGMEDRHLVTRLMHEDGHSETFSREIPPPSGHNLNHSEAGATTYFRRYDQLAITNQQPRGEDTDGVSNWGAGAGNRAHATPVDEIRKDGQLTKKEGNMIYAKAMNAGWNAAELTAWLNQNFGIEHTTKVPYAKFKAVCEYFDNEKNHKQVDSGFAPPQEDF